MAVTAMSEYVSQVLSSAPLLDENKREQITVMLQAVIVDE